MEDGTLSIGLTYYVLVQLFDDLTRRQVIELWSASNFFGFTAQVDRHE